MELLKQLENKVREMDKKMVQKGYVKIDDKKVKTQQRHDAECLSEAHK
jgi:hypothetical protein